ncbi:MAG: response regulator [Bdellovibrionota bacterium]
MKNILKNIGYSNIENADDGQNAINLLIKKKANLLVTTMELEGMNALQLTEAIRSQNLNRVKIVILLEEEFIDNLEQAFELGINAYCLKPYSTITLSNALDHMNLMQELLKPAKNMAVGALLRLAWHNGKNQNYDSAIYYADEALLLDANNPLAHITKAKFVIPQGLGDEARALCAQAIKVDARYQSVVDKILTEGAVILKTIKEKKEEKKRIEERQLAERKKSEESKKKYSEEMTRLKSLAGKKEDENIISEEDRSVTIHQDNGSSIEIGDDDFSLEIENDIDIQPEPENHKMEKISQIDESQEKINITKSNQISLKKRNSKPTSAKKTPKNQNSQKQTVSVPTQRRNENESTYKLDPTKSKIRKEIETKKVHSPKAIQKKNMDQDYKITTNKNPKNGHLSKHTKEPSYEVDNSSNRKDTKIIIEPTNKRALSSSNINKHVINNKDIHENKDEPDLSNNQRDEAEISEENTLNIKPIKLKRRVIKEQQDNLNDYEEVFYLKNESIDDEGKNRDLLEETEFVKWVPPDELNKKTMRLHEGDKAEKKHHKTRSDSDQNENPEHEKAIRTISEQAKLMNGRITTQLNSNEINSAVKDYVVSLGKELHDLYKNGSIFIDDDDKKNNINRLSKKIEKNKDDNNVLFDIGKVFIESGAVDAFLSKGSNISENPDIKSNASLFTDKVFSEIESSGNFSGIFESLNYNAKLNLLKQSSCLDGGITVLDNIISAGKHKSLIADVLKNKASKTYISDLLETKAGNLLIQKIQENDKLSRKISKNLGTSSLQELLTSEKNNLLNTLGDESNASLIVSQLSETDHKDLLLAGQEDGIFPNFIHKLENLGDDIVSSVFSNLGSKNMIQQFCDSNKSSFLLKEALESPGSIKILGDILGGNGRIKFMEDLIIGGYGNVLVSDIVESSLCEAFFDASYSNSVSREILNEFAEGSGMDLDENLNKKGKIKVLNEVISSGGGVRLIDTVIKSPFADYAFNLLATENKNLRTFDEIFKENSKFGNIIVNNNAAVQSIENLSKPIKTLHKKFWDDKNSAIKDLENTLNVYKRDKNVSGLMKNLKEDLEKDNMSFEKFKEIFNKLEANGFKDEARNFVNLNFRHYVKNDSTRDGLHKFLEQVNHKEAKEKVVEEAITKRPNDYFYLKTQAVNALNERRFSAARKWCKRMIKANSKRVDAFNIAGVSYKKENKIKKAINEYRKGLLIEPTNPKLMHNLAIALAAYGDEKESLALYSKFNNFKNSTKKNAS